MGLRLRVHVAVIAICEQALRGGESGSLKRGKQVRDASDRRVASTTGTDRRIAGVASRRQELVVLEREPQECALARGRKLLGRDVELRVLEAQRGIGAIHADLEREGGRARARSGRPRLQKRRRPPAFREIEHVLDGFKVGSALLQLLLVNFLDFHVRDLLTFELLVRLLAVEVELVKLIQGTSDNSRVVRDLLAKTREIRPDLLVRLFGLFLECRALNDLVVQPSPSLRHHPVQIVGRLPDDLLRHRMLLALVAPQQGDNVARWLCNLDGLLQIELRRAPGHQPLKVLRPAEHP
mmetsp:Transcript_12577/g.33764  ORF Transcript_12577/g.33764 Transcript_12577/m.33764 type:complete len:295 (-) Transcript_12577:221-1105(-)